VANRRKEMKSHIRRIAVKIYVAVRRGFYPFRQFLGLPISFRIYRSIKLFLFPEGQIVELLYSSRFERRDLRLVARFLKPGMNFIDIGANIGLYSILAERLVSPGGRIWAFEPSSESIFRLNRNLNLNGAQSVLTIKMALSDNHGGLLELTRDFGRGDGERFLADGGARRSFTDGLEPRDDIESVMVTTLDHYFHSELDAQLKFDFLKIDIEGGELLVFNGARRLLTENSGLVIMFESTPENSRRYGYRQEELFKFLRDQGFNLYYWDRDCHSWGDDPSRLLKSGNIWATREKSRLPCWS
jgi:FkbM family methyltransferase